MRAVVILIIAGIAGLMAYLFVVGECQGGVVVRSEEQCRSSLNATLCQTIFARANDVARNASSVYMDPVECSRQFGPCLEHATRTGGWTPRPFGFCIQSEGARLVSMVPVYRADGGRSQQ
jgi:uncharacterized protein YgiB involved in biofilm formation